MLGKKIMLLTSFVSDNMTFLTQSVRKKLSKQKDYTPVSHLL